MASFSGIQRLLLLILITKQVFTLPFKEYNGLFYEILEDVIEEVENERVLERKARQVFADPVAKWPNATIPYQFEENVFSERMIKLVEESMEEFRQTTCVRFIPRTKESDYLDIAYKPNLCGAKIGRIGGSQPLVLSEEGCYNKGLILHELMHVVGFTHEHERPDRDSHILVFKHNIRPGKEYNFKKWNSSDIAIPFQYSYETIMHYTEYLFSKDHEKYRTMLAVKPDLILPVIYFMETLPAVDIRRINAYYDCPGKEWEEEVDCIIGN